MCNIYNLYILIIRYVYICIYIYMCMYNSFFFDPAFENTFPSQTGNTFPSTVCSGVFDVNYLIFNW